MARIQTREEKTILGICNTPLASLPRTHAGTPSGPRTHECPTLKPQTTQTSSSSHGETELTKSPPCRSPRIIVPKHKNHHRWLYYPVAGQMGWRYKVPYCTKCRGGLSSCLRVELTLTEDFPPPCRSAAACNEKEKKGETSARHRNTLPLEGPSVAFCFISSPCLSPAHLGY